MLFVHSETNPASWRMVFSRSVSESSSQTIRIRTPSGTLYVDLCKEKPPATVTISRNQWSTLDPRSSARGPACSQSSAQSATAASNQQTNSRGLPPPVTQTRKVVRVSRPFVASNLLLRNCAEWCMGESAGSSCFSRVGGSPWNISPEIDP